MPNNSNNQANLPRFSPIANQPASQAFVLAAIADAIHNNGNSGGDGSQTPWASNINAAGYSISNLSTINGWLAGINMFSPTSTLTIPSLAIGDYQRILSFTGQDLIAGFMRIRGNDGANSSCDIIIHIDATPTADAAPRISICQFQGAVIGPSPRLYGQASTADNTFVLSIAITSGDFPYTLTIDVFGDAIGSLVAGATGTYPPADIANQNSVVAFEAINGQIAANSLQAKTFTIVDAMGGSVNIAESDGDIITDGYTLGDLAKAHSKARVLQIDANTPASSVAAGLPGTIAWDSDYIYVCIGINTWKRVALVTY